MRRSTALIPTATSRQSRSAVDPPQGRAGQGPLGLSRVDGGRDDQASTSTTYGPGIGAAIIPKPELPTGIWL